MTSESSGRAEEERLRAENERLQIMADALAVWCEAWRADATAPRDYDMGLYRVASILECTVSGHARQQTTKRPLTEREKRMLGMLRLGAQYVVKGIEMHAYDGCVLSGETALGRMQRCIDSAEQLGDGA